MITDPLMSKFFFLKYLSCLRNEEEDKYCEIVRNKCESIDDWKSKFNDIDELIKYHNDKAEEFNYFYILDKRKFHTLEDLLNYQSEDIKDKLSSLIEKTTRIEYSFSLYCYC